MDLVEVTGKSFNFKFVDNGKWSSYVADSFLFEAYDGGEREGYVAELPDVEYLIKTN